MFHKHIHPSCCLKESKKIIISCMSANSFRQERSTSLSWFSQICSALTFRWLLIDVYWWHMYSCWIVILYLTMTTQKDLYIRDPILSMSQHYAEHYHDNLAHIQDQFTYLVKHESITQSYNWLKKRICNVSTYSNCDQLSIFYQSMIISYETGFKPPPMDYLSVTWF